MEKPIISTSKIKKTSIEPFKVNGVEKVNKKVSYDLFAQYAIRHLRVSKVELAGYRIRVKDNFYQTYESFTKGLATFVNRKLR